MSDADKLLARRRRLSPEQLARLRERLSTSDAAVSSERIARAPEGEPITLSAGQQRMIFLHVLDPQGAAYHIPAVLELRGRLDVVALRRALNVIVTRHHVLRTVYPVAGDTPQPRVQDDFAVELETVDCSSASDAEPLIAEEVRRPFDLARELPLRARLFKLQSDRHLLCFVMHHIASDGWSMGVVIREVCALYEAFLEARPSPLPELSIQYSDYARWQRQWLEEATALEQQLSYWSGQLAGLEPLDLPTDKPRPKVRTGRGASTSAVLDSELIKKLQELCRGEGATLFMGLLTALDVVLSRYTGKSDIAIGTPVANRARRETEGLIGFFVNTVLMRITMHEQHSLQFLMAQARDAMLQATEHQDAHSELIVGSLRDEWPDIDSLIYNAYINVMISDGVASSLPGELGAIVPNDLELSPQRVELPYRARFPLAFRVFAGDTIECVLSHDPERIDARIAGTLFRRIKSALRQMTLDTSLPLSALRESEDAKYDD